MTPRQRIYPTLAASASCIFLLLITLLWAAGRTSSAQQSQPNNDQDKSKATTSDEGSLADQIKGLQKQLTELKAQVNSMPSHRIVAAGTATLQLGELQDNKKSVRVQLEGDVAAELGDDYTVLLTNRFPTTGFPLYSSYWKRAKDGFDITLVDPSLSPGETASYIFKVDKTFLIDWIVVKK